MEAHDQILHGLLDMGQMLLLCGAEINRVEDTMTRLGRAYGAKKVDIFAITSDIVLTILFEDGVELTQTRRIRKSSSFDFVKLEQLNALSRRICAEPVSAAEFRAELKKIDQEKPKAATLYLGSVVTALSFTLFFGGAWYDSLLAALVGAMICFLQQKVLPVFRNAAFFQLLTGLLAGSVICLAGRLTSVLAVDKISIGVIMLLSIFCIVRAAFAPAILDEHATMYGIAIVHSVFNILCTAMLLPAGDLLEKLSIRLVPDGKSSDTRAVELDERLLATPSLALSRSRAVASEMAEIAVRALKNSMTAMRALTPELAKSIRDDEELCDHYEDILGTYLVKLSSRRMGEAESEEATELLKSIGDFERISDHAVNILASAEELDEKGLAFSPSAESEFDVLSAAIGRILDLSLDAFEHGDISVAAEVEPLEQVIDTLKEQMRTRHILRMQQGNCSIEAGFVWSDLLTDLERTSDHCSNIAGCVIDAAQHNLNLHETLRATRSEDERFRRRFEHYAHEYSLPVPSAQ